MKASGMIVAIGLFVDIAGIVWKIALKKQNTLIALVNYVKMVIGKNDHQRYRVVFTRFVGFEDFYYLIAFSSAVRHGNTKWSRLSGALIEPLCLRLAFSLS